MRELLLRQDSDETRLLQFQHCMLHTPVQQAYLDRIVQGLDPRIALSSTSEKLLIVLLPTSKE